MAEVRSFVASFSSCEWSYFLPLNGKHGLRKASRLFDGSIPHWPPILSLRHGSEPS